MKNVIFAYVLFSMFLGITEAKSESGLGFGIIAGEPTGISYKMWFDNRRAIDAAAAWSFSQNDSFQFHTDYLIHIYFLRLPEEFIGRLPSYCGLGFRLKLRGTGSMNGRNNEDALVGIRVPLGLSFLFAYAPVDIFAEIVPVFDVLPDTVFDINAAIGVRFYFQ